MINLKHAAVIIFAVSLVTIVPTTPVRAGSSNGAVAAGIVGVVAGAIIANQMMQGARQGGYRQRPARVSKPKSSKPSSETANAKDPFAGQSTPAGYATPVNSK